VVVRQHRQQRVGRGAGAARRARPGLNVIILFYLLTLRPKCLPWRSPNSLSTVEPCRGKHSSLFARSVNDKEKSFITLTADGQVGVPHGAGSSETGPLCLTDHLDRRLIQLTFNRSLSEK